MHIISAVKKMTTGQRAFTRFRHSSRGISSRFNKKIVSDIFKCIDQLLSNRDNSILTVEAIYPVVENQLKLSHIALLKNDLTDIIIEILNFFIEDRDLNIYEDMFDDIETELKKAIWPSVSRLKDPGILDILIDEIFNELDNALEYTSENLASRFSKNSYLKELSYNELFNIAERALFKLEEMNFIVE